MAPTNAGTQSRPCRSSPGLLDGIPKPKTSVSACGLSFANTDVCLLLSWQLRGYQSIRDESLWDLPPQTFPPVLYHPCQQLAETVTAIAVTPTLLTLTDAVRQWSGWVTHLRSSSRTFFNPALANPSPLAWEQQNPHVPTLALAALQQMGSLLLPKGKDKTGGRA